jgi:RHS repeat-associated protein
VPVATQSCEDLCLRQRYQSVAQPGANQTLPHRPRPLAYDELPAQPATPDRTFYSYEALPQKFTGKERDSESGLDYFGARYYGSALGRWTSPDKPLQDQEPENPQSWNLYAYGRNNPLNGTDPTGENWFTDALQAVGNCFRYGDCHTTAVVAEHREDAFMARLVSNGKPLTPGQKEDLQQQMFGGLTPSQVIKAVDDYNSLIPHVKQDDDSGMPPMPSGFGPKPKLTSNPKHNPNSASPEPNNVKDLFDQSIEDSRGVRWAKDSDGTIHRFSRPSNGETHWNGSTAGPNAIREGDIPVEIRRALK